MKSVLLVAAFVAFPLAGCGHSSGIAPATYAQRTCTAVVAFETALTTSGQRLAGAVGDVHGSTPAVKTAVLTLLSQARQQAVTLSTALSQAEDPSGSRGASIAAGIRSAAGSVVTTIGQQRATVQAAPTSDPDAFSRVLGTLSSALSAANNRLEDALQQVAVRGSDSLNKAFASQAACKDL